MTLAPQQLDGTHDAAPGAEPVAPISETLAIARPAAGRLVWSTLLGACAVGASIGLIATAAWLISRAAQRPNEAALGFAIVLVQCFGLSRGFFRYWERLVGHQAAFRLLADLRVRVYTRLEALAPTGLPAFRSGDLLSRLVHDVDALQDLILRVLPPFGIAVLVGVATVGYVWWVLPAAGIILAVALLVAGTLVPWLTGSLARRAARGQAAARGELTASVVDLWEGAAYLTVFGASGGQIERIGAADATLTDKARSTAATAGVGLGLTTLLSGLAMWGALAVGVPSVHSGALDGVYLAVIALIPLAAFELVSGLPAATQSLQLSRRHAARVFEVLDAPEPVPDPVHPATCPSADHEVALRHLRARYPGQLGMAVDDVSATLERGKRLAVVGPSGAGKSSIAAVLLRFLAYEGSATLGAVELDQLAGDDVREMIGLVAQDAHIFDTTLANNLRIGRPGAPDGELLAALERVGLSEWANRLPKGLATELGERGMRVSGGERQRIAVARALLADFPVLVLDEPTEHLDTATADAITADLLAITAGRSTLLVTHRLLGLEEVDRIYVLDAGLVVEQGTHDELLAAGGRYAELWWRELRAGENLR